MATVQPASGGPYRLLDDSFLRFLPRPLREARRAWLAIPLAWLLSFVGSILLAFAVQKIAPNAESVSIPALPAWAVIFGFAIISPVVESILMGLGLQFLLGRMPPAIAILTSAVFWGILHSLQVPVWGLAIWWPFLIFSTLFVVWRQRGFWTGVWVAAATHMLQNLGPSLAIAYPGMFHSFG